MTSRDDEAFRLIQPRGTDVFWIRSADHTRLYYISPAYEQLVGVCVECVERDPRSMLLAIHPEDRQRVLRNIEHTREGGAFRHEYRIVRPDGTVRWIREHGYAVKGAFGVAESYVGLAQDITELRGDELERELELQRSRLMSSVEREGIWDWNIVAKTAWWSESIYSVLGIDPSTTPSYEAWVETIDPDHRERVVAGIHRAVETRTPVWSAQYNYKRPDGTVLEVIDRGYLVFDSTGAPMRMIGVVTPTQT